VEDDDVVGGGASNATAHQYHARSFVGDIHFSSSSSRYFAFFRTPSVHCWPIPFLTHRVHGRSDN
jgi:hypothetical protein